jgi:hypothetical protein
MSKTRGWRNCGCYAWRTRKPSAPIGLPFIGRHFAYVGETGSRRHRDVQHAAGGGTYNAVRKDWADLDPKVYPLPCPFPQWKWTRKAMETLYMFLLWPVYNDQKNKWNPRRISLNRARRQRIERDTVGQRGAAIWRLLFRVIVFASLFVPLHLVYTHWGK